MVSSSFLHNLSVNLAIKAEDQLRLAEITPSEDVINHLSDAFNLALKHIVQARTGTKLPEFKGYTVDERLHEFRRVILNDDEPNMEFVSFDSLEGQQLLSEYRKQNSQ